MYKLINKKIQVIILCFPVVPEVPYLQPVHRHQGIQEVPELLPDQYYPVNEKDCGLLGTQNNKEVKNKMKVRENVKEKYIHQVLLDQQIQGCQVGQGFPLKNTEVS